MEGAAWPVLHHVPVVPFQVLFCTFSCYVSHRLCCTHWKDPKKPGQGTSVLEVDEGWLLPVCTCVRMSAEGRSPEFTCTCRIWSLAHHRTTLVNISREQLGKPDHSFPHNYKIQRKWTSQLKYCIPLLFILVISVEEANLWQENRSWEGNWHLEYDYSVPGILLVS